MVKALKGDFAGALGDFERAAELAPGEEIVWNNRSAALMKLGRFDEALRDARRAVEVARGQARARINMALARVEKKTE